MENTWSELVQKTTTNQYDMGLKIISWARTVFKSFEKQTPKSISPLDGFQLMTLTNDFPIEWHWPL